MQHTASAFVLDALTQGGANTPLLYYELAELFKTCADQGGSRMNCHLIIIINGFILWCHISCIRIPSEVQCTCERGFNVIILL